MVPRVRRARMGSIRGVISLDEKPVSLHDSVVMGDISVNQITTHVVECPNCGMQGVPVIRCSSTGCSVRFCYECERRWCSVRTRDELPLCSPCWTKNQEVIQAAALALGVTPLEADVKAKFDIPGKTKTTLSPLPENMTIRKRSDIDNSATGDNDGLSSSQLLLMFTTCLFGSLIIGGTWFFLF